VEVLPEYRVQVSATRFRVPEVAVMDFSLPAEPIATHPPIAVFEVLSPEDTVRRLRRKLDDYANMGIPQIWVIDPEDGSYWRYLAGELLKAELFEEPKRGIYFRIEEIGKLVRR
jgi:Uma2 family endonuclease